MDDGNGNLVRSYSRFSHSRFGHSKFGLSTFSLSRFSFLRFGHSRFGHGFDQDTILHIQNVTENQNKKKLGQLNNGAAKLDIRLKVLITGRETWTK
jgi:hypothetical protein